MKTLSCINKFLILLSLYLILCASNAIAQDFNFISSNFNNYYFSPKNMGLSSPQISDFMKYGNIDINHYNGLLDFEIEIDRYKDNDFDIPISLKYISTGFIPSKRPSLLGVNWMLNVGGAITRTVYGTPDDTEGFYTDDDSRKYLKKGLLVAIKNSEFKFYTNSDLVNFNIDKNRGGEGNPYVSGDLKYDMEPDVFNFNFGKHSGSFIIGNNGVPVLLSGKGYKININNLAIQSYSIDENPVSSSITIIAPDGYSYEFGGDVSYLEYFKPNNPKYCTVRPRYITTWILKSIEAPNKRKVLFSYKSDQQVLKYNYFLSSRSGSTTVTSSSDGALYPNKNGYSHYDECILMRDLVNLPIITSIKIDNTEMQFNTIQCSSFFESSDFIRKLSSINIYYDSKIVRSTSFEYIKSGKYLFLSSIFNNNSAPYQFYYNLNTGLPDPLTVSLDQSGFWKGEYATDVGDVADYCTHIEENRQTNPDVADVALLNKIVYPTGGTTEILYECNRYNKCYEKNFENRQLDLKVENTEKACGGARVKLIKDCTSNSLKTRNFIYKDLNNVGSGIIGIKPKYICEEQIVTDNSENKLVNDKLVHLYYKTYLDCVDISANTTGSNENIPEYHIGYSDVIERFDDGSYIHYKYSSFLDVPDLPDFSYQLNSRQIFSSSLYGLSLAEKHGMYKLNDMSRFRGKLLFKSYYSSLGKQKMIESNTYNFEDATKQFNISIFSTLMGCEAYKIYLTPCLLLGQNKKLLENININQQKTYKYNINDLISEQEIVNSDNSIISMQYKYPTDYLNSDNVISEFISRNMINTPLEVIKCLKNNKGSWVTGAIAYKYNLLNNYPQKEKIYQLEIKEPINDYVGFSDRRLKCREEYKHSPYGRLVHCIKDSLEDIVYIWGYNNQHVIAEVHNAKYAEVASLFPIDTIATRAIPPDWDINTVLRKKLPNSQIDYYTYKPLVGLSSKIDIKGVNTYYDYDIYGRLVQSGVIENGIKKVIQSYVYHCVNNK